MGSPFRRTVSTTLTTVGIFAFFLLPFVQSLSFIEKQMLDRLLANYYDWKVRPTDKRNYIFKQLEKNPFTVNLTVEFLYFKIVEETLKLELEFVESWYDSRLIANDQVRETFQLPADSKLWAPEIELTNRKGSERCSQESYTWTRGGKLASTCRVTADVSCTYDPAKFPFEVHKCPIILSSAVDGEDTSYYCNQCIKTSQASLPLNYKLRWYLKGNHSGVDSDVYPTLELELILYHSPTSLYLCLIFVPSILLVVLAWITVFTHRKSTKSAVQSAALFGICILWSKVKTPGILAILDVWMLSCLCFIAVCIIESILIPLVPLRHSSNLHKNENSVHRNLNDLHSALIVVEENPAKKFANHHDSSDFRIRLRNNFLNRITLHKTFALIFPFIFFIFCIIYWKVVVNV